MWAPDGAWTCWRTSCSRCPAQSGIPTTAAPCFSYPGLPTAKDGIPRLSSKAGFRPGSGLHLCLRPGFRLAWRQEVPPGLEPCVEVVLRSCLGTWGTGNMSSSGIWVWIPTESLPHEPPQAAGWFCVEEAPAVPRHLRPPTPGPQP